MKRTENIKTKPEKIERRAARVVKSDSGVPAGDSVSNSNNRDMIIRRVQSAPVSQRMSKVMGYGGIPSCPWCIVSKYECLCGV